MFEKPMGVSLDLQTVAVLHGVEHRKLKINCIWLFKDIITSKEQEGRTSSEYFTLVGPISDIHSPVDFTLQAVSNLHLPEPLN
jgi:hypothetical protein